MTSLQATPSNHVCGRPTGATDPIVVRARLLPTTGRMVRIAGSRCVRGRSPTAPPLPWRRRSRHGARRASESAPAATDATPPSSRALRRARRVLQSRAARCAFVVSGTRCADVLVLAGQRSRTERSPPGAGCGSEQRLHPAPRGRGSRSSRFAADVDDLARARRASRAPGRSLGGVGDVRERARLLAVAVDLHRLPVQQRLDERDHRPAPPAEVVSWARRH